MRLARGYLPGAGGYGLTACVEAAGLGWYPAHTALGDARATADLLRHCVHTLKCPPADWAEPLTAAAELPWPRLARPVVRQRDGVPALIRREAAFGPRPPAGERPWPVLAALEGE
jgi:DNA polymerase-3 subunit epsilon